MKTSFVSIFRRRQGSSRFAKVTTLSLLLLVPLTMVSGAFAQSASEAKLERAATLLASDLNDLVVPLQHDVNVYHYFESPLSGEDLPLDAKEFQQYFDKKINDQWGPGGTAPGGGFQPAFYAAIDSAQTSNFGSSLLILKIHKGARILAAHKIPEEGFKISDATRRAINSLSPEGIDTSARFDSLFAFLPKKLALLTFKKLGVEVATYRYGQGDPLCTQSTPSAAFIVLGTPNNESKALQGVGIYVKDVSVEGLTAGAKTFDDPTKRSEYELVEKVRQAQSTSPLTTTLGALPPLTAAESQKLQQTTYACDNLYPDEPQ